jgi:hypothetical protein
VIGEEVGEVREDRRALAVVAITNPVEGITAPDAGIMIRDGTNMGQ